MKQRPGNGLSQGQAKVIFDVFSKQNTALKTVLKKQDSSGRLVALAIAGNAMITLGKSFAYALTLSPSLLAETIHSFADTCNQILLYVGIYHSRQSASREFPWGKSHARYLWNLVSAVGILFIGFGVTTYHGILSLFYPRARWEGSSLPITVTILVLSLMIEGSIFAIATQAILKKKGPRSWLSFLKSNDNPTIIAVMFEDGIAVLGVVLALAGLFASRWFNTEWPDSLASLVIGLLLGIMAVVLAITNGRLLLGASTSRRNEQEIKSFIEGLPAVEKISRLATEVLGPDRIHLSVEVELHGGVLIHREQIRKDAERIRDGEDPTPILVQTAERMVRSVGREINRIEKDIFREFPQVTSIDLEIN